MLKKLTFVFIIIALLTSAGCVPNKFQFTKEFGKPGSNVGEYLSASDMAINSKGHIIVGDTGNLRIQVLNSDGAPILSIGESGRGKFNLQSITGIGVVPTTDDILVCDQRADKVVCFAASGEPAFRITEKVKYPMDVAADKRGNIYVLMSKQSEVFKYDLQGKFIEKLGGSGKALMLFPTSIIIHNDHIYITDFGGKKIVKLDLSGQFVTEYTSKGEYEAMKGPSGIHIDEKNNLYVLDLGEVPVVILDSDGKLVSKIGDFGSNTGQFLYPTGIVAKDSGEIYVLDGSRNAILKFVKKPE